MANHVNSYLHFREINEAGVEVLNKLFERFEKYKAQYECHLGYAFVDNLEDVDREFMTEKVGAKWAYAQDWDTHGMSMYSAWRQPEEFVEYVVASVAEVDPESIAIFTYEDEMPNFIGASVYCGGDLYDAEEIDDEQIRDNLLRLYKELEEQWDSVEEEWQDEGELYFEHIFEYIDQWQNEFIDDTLQQINEDKNEQE
jgi:hypothetical protein